MAVGNKPETEKKLDGVGPIDNRPSPDKLHHFVKKKKIKKLKKIKKKLLLTPDTGHMKRDT